MWNPAPSDDANSSMNGLKIVVGRAYGAHCQTDPRFSTSGGPGTAVTDSGIVSTTYTRLRDVNI
jgi:hypothetical protein